MFSRIYMYLEQTVIEKYYGIKYSLYVADIAFTNFINRFRNVGGSQAIATDINFEDKLFTLEQSGKAIPNRTNRFEPPSMVC